MRLAGEPGRTRWLGVAALAIAAWFGLGEGIRTALAAPARFTFEVAGVADQAYGPVRASLSAGERVGVLVPGRGEADDQVRWFTAQYALAPAIVVPVRWSACAAGASDSGCGVAALERVLVAGLSPAQVDAVGGRLGLAPHRRVGAVVEYRRRAP